LITYFLYISLNTDIWLKSQRKT